MESADPWDWLETRLQAFLDAWEAAAGGAPAPAIADFAAAPPSNVEPSERDELRRTLISELVKADIEFRLARDSAQTLEHYLEAFPALTPVDADLLHHDYRLRSERGLKPSVDDYCERFPSCGETLRRLLGIDLPEASLTLHAAKKLPHFEVGAVIDNEFQVSRAVGEGSFAKVYLAQQQSLGRMVALKISAIRGNEAATLVQLDHPNIVRVHDQRDVREQGFRLIYMEYVPGGTLHDVVKSVSGAGDRAGRLLTDPVRRALERSGLEAAFPDQLERAAWPEVVCHLGMQLADALHYAHAKGVLHRDIKPANVLLGANAKPKLADFNTSFHAGLQTTGPAAYFGGSLAYMSPEQLRACNPDSDAVADDLDARSDLYSLAVMLWELLHGARPFADPQPVGDYRTLLKQMQESRDKGPPRGSWGDDLVSRELQSVLSECLETAPASRPQSGGDVARELKLCLDPHARGLLTPQRTWLGRLTLKHPLLALLATLLLPNLLAAFLNFLFNYRWIQHADVAISTFWNVQAVINSIAFPVGIIVVSRLYWPVADGARRRARGEPIPAEELTRLRRNSLRTGSCGAWIGIGLWTAAGLVYPLAIHYWEGAFPREGYLVFIIDLIACGLIAGSYPFFLATLVAIETLYPALLDRSNIPADEAEPLERLAQSTGMYLLIAAGVPLVALLLLAPLVAAGREIYQTALLGLVIAGIVGLFGAWRAHQKLQKDLRALCYAVSPLTPP